MTKPLTLLIAALGGEGGGVLTGWVVKAAQDSNLPVQATSIPGVAQRTGATTYYIEIWPQTWSEVNNNTPVFALSPAVGEIDVLASTELLETGRQIQAGYVTPDRTHLIASTHRVFSTAEKMQMGDGRVDSKQLVEAAGDRSRLHILFDMEDIARDVGAHISAVLLGAIAGCGSLPISEKTFRNVIRGEGKAVEANLAGFDSGFRAAQGEMRAQSLRSTDQNSHITVPENLQSRVREEFPDDVHEILGQGVRRLIDFQDVAYAGCFLDRLVTFSDKDTNLFKKTAKHLAVRMSFEDVIKVAQAKTRATRMRRIKAESGASPGDTLVVTEFLKPGINEFCDVLPEGLARWLLAKAARWPRLQNWQRGMELNSSSVSGYTKLKLLAGMRRWRRRTWRFRQEQETIETWLHTILLAATISNALAMEVAECSRLIKGYSDTHTRGRSSFDQITAALIQPALSGKIDVALAVGQIASAREAALADSEGIALREALSSPKELFSKAS